MDHFWDIKLSKTYFVTFIYPKNGPINNFDQKNIEMKNLVVTFICKIVLGCLQHFLGPKEDTIIDYIFFGFLDIFDSLTM